MSTEELGKEYSISAETANRMENKSCRHIPQAVGIRVEALVPHSSAADDNVGVKTFDEKPAQQIFTMTLDPGITEPDKFFSEIRALSEAVKDWHDNKRDKFPLVQVFVGENAVPMRAWVEHGFVANTYDLARLVFFYWKALGGKIDFSEAMKFIDAESGPKDWEPSADLDDIFRGIKWKTQRMIEGDH